MFQQIRSGGDGMKKARNYFQKILSEADFPGEILTGAPIVEIKGSTEAVVIRHRGIIRYDEDEIWAASSIGAIQIRGSKLNVVCMNRERIVVRGRIDSVLIGGAQC